MVMLSCALNWLHEDIYQNLISVCQGLTLRVAHKDNNKTALRKAVSSQ